MLSIAGYGASSTHDEQAKHCGQSEIRWEISTFYSKMNILYSKPTPWEFTSFSHILEDDKAGTEETDVTHLEEIIQKYDYAMSVGRGTWSKYPTTRPRRRKACGFSWRLATERGAPWPWICFRAPAMLRQ